MAEVETGLGEVPADINTLGAEEIQDVAGQLAESSGQLVSLDAIQKEDVGNVLGQLMTVNMNTEAHIDTGNLQQVLGFLVGAVRTLASGAQDSKAREEELLASQATMAQQLEDAKSAGLSAEEAAAAKAAADAAAQAEADRLAADAAAAIAAAGDDEAAKAAAAAAAEAAAAAAASKAGEAAEGLAGLQQLADTQAAEMSKLAAANDAMAAQNAELQAALEALQAGMTQMADALKSTQQTLQEEVARRALASEIQRVEDELKRVASLQAAMGQESLAPPPAAAAPAPAPTGDAAVDAAAAAAAAAANDAVAAASARSDAQLAQLKAMLDAQMAAMQSTMDQQMASIDTIKDGAGGGGLSEAEKSALTASLDEMKKMLEAKAGHESIERLENLIQTMVAAAADGGGITLPPPPDMSKFQQALDKMNAKLATCPDMAALESLKAELQASIEQTGRDAENALHALEPKSGIANMQMPAGKASEPMGDVDQAKFDALKAELEGMLSAKPEWADVEKALAKKSDVDAVLSKADRSYVEQMLRGLQETIDLEIKRLQQDAAALAESNLNTSEAAALEQAVAFEAAQGEIARLTEMLTKLEAEVPHKVDEDKLEEELRKIQNQLKKGGRGGKRGPRRPREDGDGGGGGEELVDEGPPPPPTAEDLARHQSRLEQRLGALNQLYENRGWGVRDKDVHEFLVSGQAMADAVGPGLGDTMEGSGRMNETSSTVAYTEFVPDLPQQFPPYGNVDHNSLSVDGESMAKAGAGRFSFDLYTWGSHVYKPKDKSNVPPLQVSAAAAVGHPHC
eukprot:SAG22_NODE_1050_length_5831_cov_4.044138_1_plen_798_part_00